MEGWRKGQGKGMRYVEKGVGKGEKERGRTGESEKEGRREGEREKGRGRREW